MPKPTRLTKNVLGGLRRGETIRDTVVRGLLVQQNLNGASFKVQRDLWVGARGRRRLVKTVRLTLGTTDELSVDEARTKAMAVLAQVKRGEDPNAAPEQREPGWTVGRTLDEYLADLAKRECAPKTIEFTRGRLQKHLSGWRDLPLGEVLPSKARAEHARVTKEHGKVAANKVMRDFSAAFNFARRVADDPDSLGSNPVQAITMNKERRREAVIAPDDLRAWYAKVQKLPNSSRRLMHELGLFSGLRPGVLVAIEKAWIDLESKAIVIPRERQKSRRDFALPLSAHMVGLVEKALVLSNINEPDSRWLFPTRNLHGTEVKPVQVWKETTLPSETGHILRHTHRTYAVAAGVPSIDAELLLDHKVAGIQGVYVHEAALFGRLLTQQEVISQYTLGLLGKVPS